MLISKIVFKILVVFFVLSSCAQISKLPKPKGVKPQEDLASLIWVKDLDPPYRPGKLPIGLSSPTLDGHKVLVGTPNGELLEIQTGNFQEKVLYKGDAPIYAPVLIKDNVYYFGTLGGDLIAWSVSENKIKYNVNVGAPIETSINFHDGRLIIPVRNHSLLCVDALTGKILWSYKRPVAAIKTLQRRSSALVIGKNVILGFSDGYLISFRMEDGNIQWESKVTEAESRHFQDILPTPTYFEGRVWVNTYQGYLKAYKLENGTLEKTVLEKPSSNLMVHDGHLFFASTLGDIIKINNKFEVSVHFKKLSNFLVYQLQAWGKFFVVNDHQGQVYWVDQKESQKLLKTFHLGHSYSTVFGPMTGGQNYLTLISSRNRLYLFEKEEL
jgi:outer membrane protein assembly factor BamB